MDKDNRNENNLGGKPPSKDDSSAPKNKAGFLKVLAIALFLTFLLNIYGYYTNLKNMREITYSTFLDILEKDKIEKVEIQSNKLIITPDYKKIDKADGLPTEELGEIALYAGRINDPTLKDDLRAHNVEFYAPIVENNVLAYVLVSWVLPILFLYVCFFLFMRFMGGKLGGGGLFGSGKSNAKVYMQKETGITFKDVAGQDEAKESLEEIVDFLHNPEKYKKIGAKQPKGALLVGPPGTGKTLLARAVAGEANVTFLSLSGSDFEEVYVGVGASRVRDLFKQATQNAPCIVFIDEIDAVGKSRNDNSNYSEQTLNQLLSEMDGFDASLGVVILAATNRPEVLDKALLRPGRFDRRIIVERPDLIGRENILKVHVRDVTLGDDVDLHKIALATSGTAGADLANIVNEAALRAVKLGRDKVIHEDLMEAIEVIIAGKEKKDRILSEKEKKMVAYHEVGHALAAALQKNAEPVQKITIVPRTMGALGYTLTTPEDEKFINTKDEMLAEIVVFLAGRAAEEIKFKTSSAGASNDIERASKMARTMVTQLGMSETFDMMALESIQNRYLDGRAVMLCSDSTAAKVDEEVLQIIKDSHKKAIELLSENIEALDKISEFLVEKESITGEEFMNILNEINGTNQEDDSKETEEVAETSATEEINKNDKENA